jgi:hypothetical protein
MVTDLARRHMRELVAEFIKRFRERFGHTPLVIYDESRAKIKPTSMEKVESYANLLLKHELINKGMKIETLQTKRRYREIIMYKYAVMKILYDMGYTTTSIGRHFGMSHSTVVIAVGKVNDFIDIGDDMYINIINAIKNGLQEQNGTIDAL